MSQTRYRWATVPRHLHPFPPNTLSFWTSTLAVVGFVLPSKKARVVTGFAGLLCGIGGAGMLYERIGQRDGTLPRTPSQVAKHATKEEWKSLVAHLAFGAIGLAEILKD